MAMAIFQAWWERDPSIQASVPEIWLECTLHEVTLRVSHTCGATLEGSADAMSQWNWWKVYKDRMDKLLQDKSFNNFDVCKDISHVSPLF